MNTGLRRRVGQLVRGIAAIVKVPVQRAWRARVRRSALDVTATAGARSCLVLAAHPDDETLGCGALIARKRAAGTHVSVVVATDGSGSHQSAVVSPSALAKLRARELVEACGVLGVPAGDVRQLGFVDGTLAGHVDELRLTIDALVAELDPEEVLVTCGRDWHPDHRALCEAVEASAAVAGGRRWLQYPVWYWADGPWYPRSAVRGQQRLREWLTDPFASLPAAVEVVRTEHHVRAKRAALAAYRTQTTKLTGERSWATFERRFVASLVGPTEVFFRLDTPSSSVRSVPVVREAAR